MKFSEISKKLGMALLTGAVVVSMAGMNVSAALVQSGENLTSVTVNKKVETKEKTYKPNETFTFTVNPATPSDGEKFENNVVYSGVEDGLTAGNGAEFKAAGDYVLSTEYTATGSLNIDKTQFERAGVYKYTVSENQGSYDGMVYDDSTYDVYVYVYADETTGDLSVGNVVSVKNGEKTELGFTNKYGVGDDNDTLHNIEIKKIITGNQSNMNDTFNFDVKVAGSNAEELYVVEVNGKTVDPLKGDNKTVTYTIGHDGTIKIYSLSPQDAYSVIEQANEQGYVVTIDGKNTGSLTADTTVTFTNTKNATTPTGVIMNIAPYALMVALAGVLAFFFLRRRHSEI